MLKDFNKDYKYSFEFIKTQVKRFNVLVYAKYFFRFILLNDRKIFQISKKIKQKINYNINLSLVFSLKQVK